LKYIFSYLWRYQKNRCVNVTLNPDVMDEMRDRDIRENTDQDSMGEKHPAEDISLNDGEKSVEGDPENDPKASASLPEEEVESAPPESHEEEASPVDENKEDKREAEEKTKEAAVPDIEEGKNDAPSEPDTEKRTEEKEEMTVEEVDYSTLDYSTFSLDKLIARLDLLISERPVQEIREDVEHIKINFYKKLHQETEEKRKRFLEEGGDPLDFKPAHDPLEERLKDLLKLYRHKKSVYNRELEDQKQKNLSDACGTIETRDLHAPVTRR